MKILLLLAMIMAFGVLQAHGAWWNFRAMIRNVTGNHTLMDYSFYGCYCGFGGKGSPKDATDRCCFERDCCYSRVKKEGCRTKVVHYKFDYEEDEVTCVDQDSCKKKLCECDKAAALCFKENSSSYNKRYRFLTNWRCKGQAPKC